MRILSTIFGACLACGAATALVRAQSPARDGAAETPMEEVVVTGEFPGPGMWKVWRAAGPADQSDGHVLWLVGEPPPLPKRMQWKSKDVEAVATRAQEILLDSSADMEPDEKIGLFRGLSLLPTALKARKNPDGKTLHDLLPEDVYARWLVQKKRFLGSDSGVEEWRPIFAAQKLRREAMDDLKLRESGMVWEVIEKLAKKHDIRTTTPKLKFKVHTDDIKTKLKEFTKEPLADTECFVTTLDFVVALSDTDTEARRARAWATADLDTLQALPPLPNAYVPCITAVLGSQFAREIVPADIREQLYKAWIDAAEKSLADNQTTLAIVPLAKLLRTDGYLDRLRARGYSVEAPR